MVRITTGEYTSPNIGIIEISTEELVCQSPISATGEDPIPGE